MERAHATGLQATDDVTTVAILLRDDGEIVAREVLEDAFLRRRVALEAAMPLEVVRRDVEEGGAARVQEA